LVELPGKVFEDASVKTGIFVLQKESSATERSSNPLQVKELVLQRDFTLKIGYPPVSHRLGWREPSN
jgi:hypothetical protein